MLLSRIVCTSAALANVLKGPNSVSVEPNCQKTYIIFMKHNVPKAKLSSVWEGQIIASVFLGAPLSVALLGSVYAYLLCAFRRDFNGD